MRTNENLLLAVQMMTGAAARSVTQNAGKSGGAEFRKLMTQKSQDASTQVDGGTQQAEKLQDQAPGMEQEKDPANEELCQEIAAAMTALTGAAIQPQIVTEEILPQQEAAIQTAALPVQTQETANQVMQPQGKTVQTDVGQTAFADVRTDADQQLQPMAQAQTAEQTAAEVDLTAVRTAGDAKQTRQESGGSTAQSQTDDSFQLHYSAGQEAQPLFRDVKAMPVKVGETYEVNTQSPAMDAELAGQVETALESGMQRLELRLTPENLGTVVVEMTRTQDGALQVVFHTTTEKAASMLNQHSAALGELLQSSSGQNTVQVTVQRQEENQQFQQDPNQHHGQNAPQQERRHQRSEDFLQQLRLGLVPLDAEAV